MTQQAVNTFHELRQDPEVYETAIQLLRDGWTGTISEVIQVARKLAQ